jgi:carbon-monoxide dehydrogenase medium subunit
VLAFAETSGTRRVKPARFHYVRPASIAEAVLLLAEHGDDASILAGGQSLMPVLNMRLSRPRVVIDINRIADLKGIAFVDGAVRIGALTRHVEVMRSPLIAQHLPLIAEAMPNVAHVAVRNRGTFGGSIALADPSAEMPACLLALGGAVVLESTRSRRQVAAEDYFHGLYDTARRPDELLVEALIPPQQPGTLSAFMELSRRHGDFAIAGLACTLRHDAGVIRAPRLVYFGSETRPVLARAAMAALDGKAWSPTTRAAVIAALAGDLDPIDNTFGSPTAKLHLQRVVTERVLDRLLDKARAA